MVEVGAEVACTHQVAQAAVGCRDDAHVHGAGAVVAQPLDLAVLQGTQQLGLHQQRQFADFIQEQRAAVGGFEPAGAVGDGAGKGAFGVAEQFAFGQGFGQGGAVHMYQRLVAPAREAVHAMREQLLAHPRFTEQEDGQFGVGHDVDFVQEAADGFALAQDVAAGGGGVVRRGLPAGHAQRADLGFQAGGPQRGLQ
ncbi:hypothetical protein D3C72_1538810 [compost metagenome]